MAILSLVIAQVLSRQQKLQGKQHELARKRSQEGSASVSWRFPGARKVRTCWQAGRAVSPALCHKSLCEGCWLWQSGERAVLHHTWLLLNTSVLCTGAWATPGWLEVVSHLYQQKEHPALPGPSKNFQQTPVLITVVIFLPLSVFNHPVISCCLTL